MHPLSIHAWLRWDTIERLLPVESNSMLEIGAGLGSMGAMLAKRFDYTGLEPDRVSQLEATRRTTGRVLRQRVEEHRGVYDCVCAFEVLEHIDDDVAALRLWRQHSRKWLLLSVPLNPHRFGAADEHAGHFRRYTVPTLSSALIEAGWKPQRLLTYGFPIGYALEAVRHRLAAQRPTSPSMRGRTAESGRWLQPPAALGWATWAAALPFRAVQRPFGNASLGTGLVALAELVCE